MMDIGSVKSITFENGKAIEYKVISSSKDQQGRHVLILLRDDGLEILFLTFTEESPYIINQRRERYVLNKPIKF